MECVRGRGHEVDTSGRADRFKQKLTALGRSCCEAAGARHAHMRVWSAMRPFPCGMIELYSQARLHHG